MPSLTPLNSPRLFLGFALLLIAAAPSPVVIRNTLQTYVKAHPDAVVAMGVVDRGRTTTYYVRGAKSKVGVDGATRFQIGSITKIFTADLLAELVDAGKAKLDDPLQAYLPSGVVVPEFQGKQITLVSLAQHMSGLPPEPANANPQSFDTYTLAMLDDALQSTKLDRAPGAKWEYSNFAFALLGQAVAEKEGDSYDHLVKARILDPLGMNATVVSTSDTRKTLAPPFAYGGGPGEAEGFGARGPAGSLESDLNDMLIFLNANLETPATQLGRDLAFAQQARTPIPEYNMSMGLAWSTVLPASHRLSDDLGDLPADTIEKGGNTNGYSSLIALNHERDWGFVALTNVNDDDFQQVVEHAISPSTAQMPVMWAIVPKQPSPLSGRYAIIGGKTVHEMSIFRYRDNLYVGTDETTPTRLTPLGGLHYSWDDLRLALTFNVNARGQATGMTMVQGGRTIRARRLP